MFGGMFNALRKPRNPLLSEDDGADQEPDQDIDDQIDPDETRLSQIRDHLQSALGNIGHGSALQNYRSELESEPTRDQYKPSFGRKLLGLFGGGLAGLTGHDPNTGGDIIDAPYLNALKEHQSRLGGLKTSADIEHNQENAQIRALQGEEAIAGNIVNEKRYERQAAERERADRAREAQAKADADARDEQAERRHEEMMGKLGKGEKRRISLVDEEDGKHRMDLDTGEDLGLVGPRKKTADELKRGDQAEIVQGAINQVREYLKDPDVAKWMGGAAGAGADFAEAHPLAGYGYNAATKLGKKFGFKGDEINIAKMHEFQQALTSLDSSLSILHGYRGGPEAHKIFKESMGQFSRDPKSMEGSLRALEHFITTVSGALNSTGSNPAAPKPATSSTKPRVTKSGNKYTPVED